MITDTRRSRRIARCALVVAVTALLSVSWPSVLGAQTPPVPPQVFLDTTYAPPSGGVISVPEGGDFQAALNVAQPGQIIELAAGATYVSPADGFVLRPKRVPNPVPPGWNPWIYIRSSAHANLPPPGTRVSPADANLMPKIELQNPVWGGPAIRTGYDQTLQWVAEYPCSPSPGQGCPAHHYRFVGIEITTTHSTRDSTVANLVILETLDRVQQSLSLVPTDIVFDRSYIHGTPTGNVRHAIAMNSARTAVIDSYLSDFHEYYPPPPICCDSQAIMGWNGPGPFKIVNNYLEGAGENIMFGGADPTIPDLVPADIEIRRNHFFKPLSWRVGDPTYAGTPWVVKNLFELKNARRVLVDGNIFENNWTQADQSGFAIVFTPRNQNGGSPWSTVEDVTFTRNIITRSTAGVHFLGWDTNGPSQQLQRVLVQNTLFVDIGKFPDTSPWGLRGVLFLFKNGTKDVTIDHNTAFQTEDSANGDGAFVFSDGPRSSPPRPVHTGTSFFRTIAANKRYGFLCENFPPGEASVDGCFSFGFGADNVIYGPWGPPYTDMTPSSYGRFQSDHYFPASVNDVRFEDLGPLTCNYRLRTDSLYYRGGNGNDIGAYIDTIEDATGQSIQAFCNGR